MIKNGLKLLIFFPLFASAGENKLGAPSMLPYPMDWPALITKKSCANLSGTYRFSGLSTIGDLNVQSIFYRSLPGPDRESVQYLNIEMLDAGHFNFYYLDGEAKTKPIFWFASKFECVDGAWIGDRNTLGSGDGNPTKVWTKVYLYTAQDGSLISFNTSYSVQRNWVFFERNQKLDFWSLFGREG